MALPSDKVTKIHPIWYDMSLLWEPIMALEGRAPELRRLRGRYLPVLTGEDEKGENYSQRVALASLEDFFNKGIESNASKPFTVPVELTAPPDLKAWEDDVDRAGTTLTQFAKRCVITALSRGIFHVRVLLPSSDIENPTQGDVLEKRLQPYFSLIEPYNLRGWDLDDHGQPIQLNVWDGQYTGRTRSGAATFDERVTCYFADHFETYTVKISMGQDQYGRERIQPTGDPYEGTGDMPYSKDESIMLERPPIVTGYGIYQAPLYGIAPSQSVADMNLELFRLSSEYQAYMSSGMARAQVFEGVDRLEVNRQGASKGSNRPTAHSTILLGDDQAMTWSNPGVEASSEMREYLNSLRERMESRIGDISVGFETATAEVLTEVRATSELHSVVEQVKSVLAEAYRIALTLMGQNPDQEIYVDINKQIIAEDVQADTGSIPSGGAMGDDDPTQPGGAEAE